MHVFYGSHCRFGAKRNTKVVEDAMRRVYAFQLHGCSVQGRDSEAPNVKFTCDTKCVPPKAARILGRQVQRPVSRLFLFTYAAYKECKEICSHWG